MSDLQTRERAADIRHQQRTRRALPWALGACVGLLVVMAGAGARTGIDEPVKPAPAPGAGAMSDDRGEGPLSSVSEAALRAWSAEVRPKIEQIAGRTFAADVEVRVVDKDELARVLNESVQRDMQREHPEMDATMLYVRSMHASYQIADRTIGMYNRPRKCVYVVVQNLGVLFKGVSANRVLLGKIARLAIAHELVHALQEQHVDTGKLFDDAKGHDAQLALKCVIEGHAVVVTDALAEQIGWQDANGQIWAVTTGPTDRGDRKRGQDRGLNETEFVYVKGRALVRKRMEAGGVESAWALFKGPPTSVQAVEDELETKEQFMLPEPSAEPAGRR